MANYKSPAPQTLIPLNHFREQLFSESYDTDVLDALSDWCGSVDRDPIARQAGLYVLGLAYRRVGRYEEAQVCYQKLQDPYLVGFCAVLCHNWDVTKQMWQQVLDGSPYHWCGTLFGLLTQNLNTRPSLFQLRAHLEGEFWEFLQAGHQQGISGILDNAETLSMANPETFKILGRTIALALTTDPIPNDINLPNPSDFFHKALHQLPNDPELFYHWAQWDGQNNNRAHGELMLNQCLLICPDYQPALALQSQWS